MTLSHVTTPGPWSLSLPSSLPLCPPPFPTRNCEWPSPTAGGYGEISSAEEEKKKEEESLTSNKIREMWENTKLCSKAPLSKAVAVQAVSLLHTDDAASQFREILKGGQSRCCWSDSL